MENLTPAYLDKQMIMLSCIDIEMAAAEIYMAFMKMFPEEAEFWGELALEEQEHARLYVASDILKIAGEFAGIKLPAPAFVARTIAYAEQIKEQIRTRPITLKEAAEMALKLEQTITERVVFELPASDNPIIENFRKIFDETESHADRIERLMVDKGFTLIE